MKSFLTAPRLLQDTDGNQVRADQIAGPNGQLLPARDYDEEPTAPPPKAKTPCPADGCCESFTSVGNLANHVLLKHRIQTPRIQRWTSQSQQQRQQQHQVSTKWFSQVKRHSTVPRYESLGSYGCWSVDLYTRDTTCWC